MSDTVRDQALRAYVERQLVLDAQRKEHARIRAEEEAAADAECLAWVAEHPWIKLYLPDTTWVLLDRKFPQETAVVHPDGEPDLRLIVTRTQPDHASLAADTATGRSPNQWLLDASRCRDLIDLGMELSDRTRRRTAVVEVTT